MTHPNKIFSLLLIRFFFAAVLGFAPAVYGQPSSNFNVELLLYYSAAEQCLTLFEDQYVNTQTVAELRGNRIAASTTGMISDKYGTMNGLQNYLDSLRYHQIIRSDIYHLEEARKNVSEIKNLLEEMKRRNFSRRVAATVEQIFPQDAQVALTIPVYIVALGHENVDAYVRRIIWHGDIPRFVGEDQGELTIVINLAQSVKYGFDIEERFITLLGVVAHEVFHAAFSAYKENSSTWKHFYQEHRHPFDVLLDLTHNEGIAYYLSLDQLGRGYLPREWDERMRVAFLRFNEYAGELLSDTITADRSSELIRKANLSGYWESFGSMVGMTIARTIDLQLGRSELINAISEDPYSFFIKYIMLTKRDNNLPKFLSRIGREILQNGEK